MEFTWNCPECSAIGRTAVSESLSELKCPRCGYDRPIAAGSIVAGELAACAYCASTDLYVQKDFPHGLGLAIVVVGLAVSTVFYYFDMPFWTMFILILSAVLDFVLYKYVPEVTICYRCLTQSRGEGSNPGGRYAPFDLAIGERYRQERIRAEELRGRAAAEADSAANRLDSPIEPRAR